MEKTWKRSSEEAPKRKFEWPDPELCFIKESMACWWGRHQHITSSRRALAEDVKTQLARLVGELQDQSFKLAGSPQDQDPTHELKEKLAPLERLAAHMASELEWSLVDDYYSTQAV